MLLRLSQNDGGQYFYLTPKLPRGLDLDEGEWTLKGLFLSGSDDFVLQLRSTSASSSPAPSRGKTPGEKNSILASPFFKGNFCRKSDADANVRRAKQHKGRSQEGPE